MDRHVGENAAALWRMRDASLNDFVGRASHEVLAFEFDCSGSWPKHATNCPEQCALARTIRADDRHNLTLIDIN